MDTNLSSLVEELHRLNELLEKLVKTLNPTASETADVKQLTSLLHTMGMPANLKGYSYLCEAIIEVAKDAELATIITTLLYPDIAKRHNVTQISVERAIRHAIEIAWSRTREKDMDVFKEIFSNTISTDRPTSGEFIATLAEKIRHHC